MAAQSGETLVKEVNPIIEMIKRRFEKKRRKNHHPSPKRAA